jgi:hypothetical protein
MPSPRPRLLAPTPDFKRLLGDAARHKELARRAYRDAREAEPLSSALIDRLWVRTLQATEIAPQRVALKMFRRSETLMRLMVDVHRWPTSR